MRPTAQVSGLLTVDFFSKSTFWKNALVSNSLGLNYFVRPDLGPNCLQKFSADGTSR